MLTIVTGLPGAGKTLYTLSKIIPEYKGRMIYTFHVDGIDHDHFNTTPLENVDRWFDVPDGSVVIIDEAWEHFPTRSSSQPIPEKCTRINEHRHRGIDMVILTQDVRDIDVHLRRKGDRHIHLSRVLNAEASNVFEYKGVQTEPEAAAVRKTAIDTQFWLFDKSVYDHYNSASLHTMKKRIPKKIIIACALVLLAIAAAIAAIFAVRNLLNPDEEAALVMGPDGVPLGASQTVTKLSFAEQFTPEVEGIPWSAPIWQTIARPQTFPKPHCIIIERSPLVRGCRCYTQQATRMHDVDAAVCKDLAVNGWFDYTREDEQRRGGGRAERGPTRPDASSSFGSWEPSS